MEDKFLSAYTPTLYKGHYPPYLNIVQIPGGMVRVTIRGQTKEDGSCGDTVTFECNVWNLNEFSKSFKEAVDKFNVENP